MLPKNRAERREKKAGNKLDGFDKNKGMNRMGMVFLVILALLVVGPIIIIILDKMGVL